MPFIHFSKVTPTQQIPRRKDFPKIQPTERPPEGTTVLFGAVRGLQVYTETEKGGVSAPDK